MKTVLLRLFQLLGAALLASAGEPAQRAQTQQATPVLTKNAAVATNVPDAKTVEKIVWPGGTALKMPRSALQTVGALLNPLAPLEQPPATPWLQRAAWTTAADKVMASPGPAETRHESQLCLIIIRPGW
jgi:hypothetical protein